MAKITLGDVANLLGNPTSAANTINTNNTAIEQAIENSLSRDGTTPNQMLADFDMNNNDILNVKAVSTEGLILDGRVVLPGDEITVLPESVMTKPVYDPQGISSDVFDEVNHGVFSTRAEAISTEIPVSYTSVLVKGKSTEGDSKGGVYISTNNGSKDTFTSVGGRVWYKAPDINYSRVAPIMKMPDMADRYRWKVVEVAQNWPDLAASLTLYGATSFYTQWAWLDEDRDLIFISRTPNTDSNGYGLVVLVRKFSTWEYVTSFTPTNFAAGWGWINRAVDANVYMEGRNGTQSMARWNVTTLPSPLSFLAATATYTGAQMDAYTYATAYNGEAVIGQYTAPKGGTRSFTRYSSFDKTLARTGKTYQFRTDQVGSNVEPALSSNPHMQGFSKGNGFFFSTFGAIYKTDGSTPVSVANYMGLRIFSDEPEPRTLVDGLVDPQKFLALIQSQLGITSNRIEGEGCFVTKDGRCFGLFINKWATTGMDTGGYLLIEFFSKDEDAIDVSSCSVAAPGKVKSQPASIWDMDGGQYRNPTTGIAWNSINEMCDWLASSDALDNGIDRIQVYGNFLPTAFIDINGVQRATGASAIRNASHVTLISVNTTTFMLYVNSTTYGVEYYVINGSPRVQSCFSVPTSRNYTTDANAAAGGVPVGGMYHNAGAVRVRLT